MHEFIKETLEAAFDKFDKIYIHCAPREDVYIGKRGLQGPEKKDGIMLSFSMASAKNMKLENDGVSAELRFAGKWEEVFLPYDAIDALLDDLQEPSFIFNFIISENLKKTDEKREKRKNGKTAEILKPDFTKPRK